MLRTRSLQSGSESSSKIRQPQPLSLQVVWALGAVHCGMRGQLMPIEILEPKALECAADVLDVIDATHELSDQSLATLERLTVDVCKSSR